MDEVRITTDEKSIMVDTEYKYKNICKDVKGKRWDPHNKQWKYPKTPSIAYQIVSKFKKIKKKKGIDLRISASKEVRQLLDQAKKVAKAQRYKKMPAEKLPDVQQTKFPAWEHQKQAFHFARHLHSAGLFMDMGTGKTKVMIDVMNHKGFDMILIASPLSVVDVWVAEVEKHSVREYIAIGLNDGSVKEKKEKAEHYSKRAKAEKKPFIVTINYESLWRSPFSSWALKQEWDAMVCDESHRIKTAGAKCSRFAYKLGKRIPHKYALTGTPMANNPLDLYGQYRFLDPGIFGTSKNRFENRYAIKGGYGGYEIKGYQNQEEMRKKMMSIAYQCKSDDVLDLPERIFINRYCNLSKETQQIYTELEANFYTEVEDKEVTALNVLTKLLRLQQVTSGYLPDDEGEVHQLGSEKKDLFGEVLDEIPDDEPVVVFTRFIHDIENVREVAEKKGYDPAELSGRSNELKEFQAGDKDLIVVQIQAGGVGIDLTESHYAIYYSMGYSLKDYEQSKARLHRPGQDHSVRFIHLIAKHTVDEKVFSALENKKEIIDHILEGVVEDLDQMDFEQAEKTLK